MASEAIQTRFELMNSIKIFLIILLMSMMVSGCSASRMLQPYTEQAKCMKNCEERYRTAKDKYGETMYKQRCEREYGPDDQRGMVEQQSSFK